MTRMFSRARERSAGSEARGPVADAFIAAYVDWREAAAAVRDSYQLWFCAGRHGFHRGHAAYTAALDREEAAARELRFWTERASRARA